MELQPETAKADASSVQLSQSAIVQGWIIKYLPNRANILAKNIVLSI
jgi:hypothetical protein